MHLNVFENKSILKLIKNCEKTDNAKVQSRTRRLFDMDEESSESSNDSVVYISGDEESQSEGCESDYSTGTEEMVARIEQVVTSSPMLIGGRIMTTGSLEGEMAAGPSSAMLKQTVTHKFDRAYFDGKLSDATSKGKSKRRIELSKTILPVLESPLCPLPYERVPSRHIPITETAESGIRACYYIQNTTPYENVSEVRYTGCMVCGRSVEAIKKEKVSLYLEKTTRIDEPEYITKLRKAAYESGLNAGSFLFLAPAVSQVAGCDRTMITTTTDGQDIARGTLFDLLELKLCASYIWPYIPFSAMPLMFYILVW